MLGKVVKKVLLGLLMINVTIGGMMLDGTKLYAEDGTNEAAEAMKEICSEDLNQEDYDFYYYGSGRVSQDYQGKEISDAKVKKAVVSIMSTSSLKTDTPISTLTTSQTGIDLIKKFEGCVLHAYDDLQPSVTLTESTTIKGTLTIGYGHTGSVDGSPIAWNTTIDEAKAEELLKQDLLVFETAINKMAIAHSLVLTQNQFDALASFSYNVGAAWTLDSRTAVIKTYMFNGIANYSNDEIVNAFSLWNTSGGVVLPGLTRRRRSEAAVFVNDATASQYKTGKYTIAASSLTVRTGPGFTYANAKNESGDISLTKDTEVEITAISNDYWGQCSSGWILLDYARFVVGSTTEVVASPYTIGFYAVKANYLNLRTGPGTSYDVVKALSKGTAVYVSETSDKWGKTANGWLSLDYCESYSLGTTSISSLTNNSDGVKIAWKKVSDASGYTLYKLSGLDWVEVDTISGAKNISYTDEDAADNGQVNEYMICAFKTIDSQSCTSAASESKMIYSLNSVSIKSLKSSKTKRAVVKWKKNSKASGYEIAYSTRTDFRNAKIEKITKASTTKKTLKLKAKRKYYVRIRSYIKVDGVKYYSSWSSKKSVNVK